MSTEIQPVRIFIAYSSKDLAFKEEIRRRLKPLLRAGKVSIWDNYNIEGGGDWDADIREKLGQADIILLLLSPDALDSDYFYDVEAPIALQRHEAGQAIAVGVLLRPCALKHTPFEKLERYELLPKKGYPITDPHWHHADAAYLTIFEEIDLLVEKVEGLRLAQIVRLQRRQEYANLALDANVLLKEKKWAEALAVLNNALTIREVGFEPMKEGLEKQQKKCEEELLALAEAERRKREEKERREKEAADEQARAMAVEKQKAAEAARRLDPFADLMLPIKGGSFDMGDTFGDGGESEKPVHRVTIQDFHLCKYPVTQAQWQTIMGNNPSYFQGDENLPVEKVSWDEAQNFIQKLNEKTGKKYRLPSEAEWEYAAREGGKKVRFGNGKDKADPKEINFNGSEKYKKDYSVVGEYRQKTTPVNAFAPNALGLHDLSGNVWEWCQDVWHNNYQGAPTNGSAWEQGGDDSRRVLRGGSWYFYQVYCRVSYRYGDDPEVRNIGIGFRLARHL